MRRSARPAATAQSGRECCSRSAAARITARPLSGFFKRCITSDSEETTAPVSVCSISMPLPLERHRSPTPARTGTSRTFHVAMTPCISIDASMIAEQVGPSSAKAARANPRDEAEAPGSAMTPPPPARPTSSGTGVRVDAAGWRISSVTEAIEGTAGLVAPSSTSSTSVWSASRAASTGGTPAITRRRMCSRRTMS
ncbi:unannotated protein [freshwater metagenome]|uniref:Unannotated protein n=1 Tax=freshwater metagenome TaxID=449393 RepID=A0A6J6T081_9ZZZZ